MLVVSKGQAMWFGLTWLPVVCEKVCKQTKSVGTVWDQSPEVSM